MSRIILPESVAKAEAAKSWREHPIAAAAIAAVGAIGLCVLLFNQIILPTQTAALENALTTVSKEKDALEAKLQKEVVDLQARVRVLEAERKGLQAQLVATETKVGDSNKKLREAQLANLFSAGNPYPLGLGEVRIGEHISKVGDKFPAKSIKKEDEYWSVTDQHKVFKDVTYYFDEKSSLITHILFHFGYSDRMGESFLQTRLTEALGAPKTWSRKGHYSWTVSPTVTLFKSDVDSYILMGGGMRLARWPSE